MGKFSRIIFCNTRKFSTLKLLPILCHILHVDNISEAQEWLVNANFTGLFKY